MAEPGGPSEREPEGVDTFLMPEPTKETLDPAHSTSEVQDAGSSEAECNRTFSLGTITWLAPLAWLEQTLPHSPILTALRQSLAPASQQEKGPSSTLLSVASAATWTFPPSLPEADQSTSPGAALLRQDTYTSTPVSVASVAVWTSPADLLDPGSNALMEQEGSPALHQAPGTSIVPGSEVPIEVPQSPICLMEGSVNTASEEEEEEEKKKPSVVQPDQCPGMPHVGCSCHGIWTSPLSLLEAEASPTWTQDEKGTSVSPASTEVWTTPSGLPEARANAGSVPHEEKSTGTTPVSVSSVATWTARPSLLETGVNTSLELKPSTQESTTETDSLLWHCSHHQLSGLSRADLEGRLESALVIVEVLGHQIRASQELWRPSGRVGPADQRDSATQTPLSEPKEEERLYQDLYVALRRKHHDLQRSRESERELVQRLTGTFNEMRALSSETRLFQEKVDASFQNLQEDRRSLAEEQKQMSRLLPRCQNQLQAWRQKQEAMKKELGEAWKAKEAADTVRESVQSHSGARIKQLEQGAESQRRLHALLQQANEYKAELSLGYAKCGVEGDRLAGLLQQDWAQMGRDYEVFQGAIARCQATMKRMEVEVEAAVHEHAHHQEVCRKLEERTVEVVAALGRVNELVEANTGLHRDLKGALQKTAAVEEEKAQVQRENGTLSQLLGDKQEVIGRLEEETARLSREQERAEQERNGAQRDLREAADCREFLEQENRIARRQLSETEEELKATLSALRQRSTQLEDLKDTHEKFRQEQEALSKALASSEAEVRSAQACIEAFSEAMWGIGSVQAQFLDTADFFRAVLRGEGAEAAQRSSSHYTPGRHTPHRLGASFVDSILQAAAEKGTETPGLWSETTAFTRTTLAAPPTPSEVQEHLDACVQGLWDTASQLRVLSSQCQKAAQEEVETLEGKILQLERELESTEQRLQAEVDAGQASIAKLNRALHMRIQNEKELQEVLWQQDEKIRLMADQSREVASLQEEVTQLKQALHKSETEAATLWKELRGTKSADADWVQEKVLLQQQLGKLRELLLQKDREQTEHLTNYLGRVQGLERRLHQAQQVLREHKKVEAKMREVLSTLPPDVASLSVVHRLSELLGGEASGMR